MLLLILAIIWAGVVVSLVRDRVGERPSDSIGSFRNQLRVLQRTAPATFAPANSLHGPGRALAANPVYRPAPTASRNRTVERRRQVFLVLLSAMAGTLVLGLIPALRPLLYLHVVLDLAFAGYVGLLINLRNQAAEREMKLRFLPGSEPMAEPVLLLRRSAN